MKRVILSAAALLMAVAAQAKVVETATLRFKLDETAQETMVKESVSGADAKLSGKRKLGEVKEDSDMGWVREFKGGQNAITTPEVVKNSKDGSRTVAFWINPAKTVYNAKQEKDLPQKNIQLFSVGKKSEEPGVSAVFSAVLLNGKTIRVNTGRTDGHSVMFNAATSLFDSWSHVAITVGKGGNGKSIKLYVNGEEVPVSKYMGTADDVEGDFTLTVAETPMHFGLRMNGAMSEFVVFDKELSAADVATLMSETK